MEHKGQLAEADGTVHLNLELTHDALCLNLKKMLTINKCTLTRKDYEDITGKLYNDIPNTNGEERVPMMEGGCKNVLDFYRNNKIELALETFENIAYDFAFNSASTVHPRTLATMFEYYGCKDNVLEIICHTIFFNKCVHDDFYIAFKDSEVFNRPKYAYLRVLTEGAVKKGVFKSSFFSNDLPINKKTIPNQKILSTLYKNVKNGNKKGADQYNKCKFDSSGGLFEYLVQYCALNSVGKQIMFQKENNIPLEIQYYYYEVQDSNKKKDKRFESQELKEQLIIRVKNMSDKDVIEGNNIQ